MLPYFKTFVNDGFQATKLYFTPYYNKKAQLMLAYPRDAKNDEKNSSISKL